MEEEVCSLSQVSTLKSTQLHGFLKFIHSFIYFYFFILIFLKKRNELYFVGGKEVQQLAVANSGLYVKSASSLPLQAFQLPPRVHGHAH